MSSALSPQAEGEQAHVVTPDDEATLAPAPPEAVDDAPARVPAWRIVKTAPLLKWLVLPLALLTLLLALSFLARTQLVVGPLMRDVIAREAQRRGMDLYIGEVRPAGLTGVRLHQVRARLRRGHYILDTQLAAVDLSPDLIESFRQRRPVPQTVVMHDGVVRLERAPTAARASVRMCAWSWWRGARSRRRVRWC